MIITTGDPGGIGPEVTSKALASKDIRSSAEFVIIGSLKTRTADHGPSALGGREAYANILRAVKIITSSKRPAALVTAPISKHSLYKADIRFSGHTEILAGLTGVSNAVMMFSGGYFKLALVTRHIPVKAVPTQLSKEKITGTISLFAESLKRDFGIKCPRIGVLGLNPHAGEAGLLGDEEKRIIMPAIRAVSNKGVRLSGPIPPDVAFRDMYTRAFDGLVAMYHDQGLIPFKMLYFEQGVNVTLGLPFVRTSPDHGTAFDIAGKGKADPSSMIEAVKLACLMAGRR